MHPANLDARTIDVRAVSKFFGNSAVLHDVTFSVDRGERALLLGEPGSGKSTLLKVLAGHVTPSGGRVRICGVDGRTSRLALNARIGFVGQRIGPVGTLGVADMLRFSGRAKHLPEDTLEQRVAEVLELCELDARAASSKAAEGEHRVREAVALALLHAPDVLLLDSCLSGHNPRECRAMTRTLDRLRATNLTVLASGGPGLERAWTADRSFQLRKGRLHHHSDPLEKD